jgi:RNA 3'-phosphate cyclase
VTIFNGGHPVIDIDGSYLEGGGQIVRTATALSAVTGRPCRIFNIRKGRSKPGLATQHVAGLQVLSRLCNGWVEGALLGSREITFVPARIEGGNHRVKVATAGSISLILQLLVLAGLFGEKPLILSVEGGATDTAHSPTIDHFRFVFLKVLEKLGAKIEINILRRGFYPKGGGRVEAIISPCTALSPLMLSERGNIKKVAIISGAAYALKQRQVAERQVAGAMSVLAPRRDIRPVLVSDTEYYGSVNPGSQITLLAEYEHALLGTDNLGKVGKRAEEVGREAAVNVLREVDRFQCRGCLDRYVTDQVLPYLALTGKESTIMVTEITDHAKTNMWVIEKFLSGKFEVDENMIRWIPAG